MHIENIFFFNFESSQLIIQKSQLTEERMANWISFIHRFTMTKSNESSSSKMFVDANNNINDPFDTNRFVIKSFYTNACVLVTGGTGFLGKVLIEKLLRTCENIQCVYVLVRSKRGLSSEKRYADLIKNPVSFLR